MQTQLYIILKNLSNYSYSYFCPRYGSETENECNVTTFMSTQHIAHKALLTIYILILSMEV